MTEGERTRVAVLGTLAEFHREPIAYDMAALLELVAEVNPDLLCLDMTPEQWQEQEFDDLPPEYQETLLPLAHQTDIVVAPIGGGQPPSKPEAGRRRARTNALLRRLTATIQRTAPGPDAINQGWRHHLVNLLYDARRQLAGSNVKREANEHAHYLIREVTRVTHRDPSARILVVVNVQYCHILRERLREDEDLEIVNYSEL
jgi:hypothetical protein